MKITVRIFLIIGTISLLASCKKPPNTIHVEFPLVEGTEWIYAREMQLPEGLIFAENIITNEHVIKDTVILKIGQKTTLENNQEVFPLICYLKEFPENQSVEYVNSPNNKGLWCYAYNPGYTVFKSLGNINKFSLSGYKANQTDTILYQPPVVIFDYPLNEWTSWELTNNITKSVIAQTKITVDAGTFDAFKIEYDYPNTSDLLDNNLKVFEYLSQEGLVYKVYSGEMTLTDEMGDPIGKGFLKETIELIKINYPTHAK